MNLYEIKQSLKMVGDQLAKVVNDIVAKSADPNVPIEEVQNLKGKKSELQERFDTLKETHDKLEAEMKAGLAANKGKVNGIDDPKQKTIAAKASLIRSVIRDEKVTDDIKAALGDGNSTGGEKILPSTMTNELLHEPFVKNPLRNISTFTSVTNLEIPKVSFTLDDDDFIDDTETAKELKVEGDVVNFGRHKFKVFAGVSETILSATDTNLVQTVEAALRSGLAAKEKKVAFTKSPKQGEEHMSFYQKSGEDFVIKEVKGANLYKAIKAALADLHEDYRENAKIVMRYSDYMDIIEVLANNNITLYSAQPEQVLGKPVEFCDLAEYPVVGDFSYSHFNYDPEIIYDRDKNVRTGVWDFVLTAWIDHQIKLKSAFRIASVEEVPTP